jgi:hypothetical protein
MLMHCDCSALLTRMLNLIKLFGPVDGDVAAYSGQPLLQFQRSVLSG